jgi:hypothetical protein
MIAGSVTVRAKPWCRPSRAKFALNLACGLATRKSAAQASPSPPPTAAPWMAATTGVCASNSRAAAAYSSIAPPIPGRPERPVKSAPAQKCLPSEHSTAARNSGCSSSHA